MLRRRKFAVRRGRTGLAAGQSKGLRVFAEIRAKKEQPVVGVIVAVRGNGRTAFGVEKELFCPHTRAGARVSGDRGSKGLWALKGFIMPFNTFPELGKELKRLFDVHENCYDCAGFYDGCRAWPASKDFACGKYNPLPDVPAGTCGQRFPATSRTLGAAPTDGKLERPPETRSAPSIATRQLPRCQPKQARRQSPIATRALSGERLCECGATLPERKRCCDACRVSRRRETMRRRRSGEKRPSVAVDAGSGVPFPASGTLSTRAGSRAHNYLGLRYGQQTSV